MSLKKYPTIGCCGIDCGLCPRHYTAGSSRCPGCGGEGFEQVHPSCSFITCCVKKRGLEVCAECSEFPCNKFDKETGERDSFVTHRRIMFNQQQIAETGLETFLDQQAERISFLTVALERYDDGRGKNYFRLAAALLSVDSLKESLSFAENGGKLRDILKELAEAEGQELVYHK